MLSAGDRIGDWVVVRTLGEGGMGAVYLCHGALSERMQAAVKVLKHHELEEGRLRFVREMEALARLRHPAIVAVMGSGEDASRGFLWMAMEFVRGQTLEATIARGPLPWPDAVALVREIALGLAFAHAQGIRHRDIKPANVMLCEDGSIKLLDFGIAVHEDRTRLTTDQRSVPGTLAYIPPEVFEGGRPDPVLSDVYALGLVLYEVLVGRRAFPEDPDLSAPQRMARIMAAKLTGSGLCVPDDTPPALARIIEWATARSPSARLPDAETFLAALEAVQQGALDELPPLGPRNVVAPPPRFDAFTGEEPLGRAGETIDTGKLLEYDPLDVEIAEDPPPRSVLPAVLAAVGVGAAVVVGGVLWALSEPPAPPEPPPELPVLPAKGPGWALAPYRYTLERVAPGDFWMGAAADAPERAADEDRHPARITRPYLLGKTEVTQELWVALMGENPAETGTWEHEGRQGACSEWGVGADLPVHCVSFRDVITFLNVLSLLEELEPAYGVHGDTITWNRAASGYRLPTEAEWELAAGEAPEGDPCASANVANRSTKDKHYSWLSWGVFDCEDGFRELAPVAKRAPNARGLYDMTGNVREWTWDFHGPYAAGTSIDPAGPVEGTRRVVRGGGWSDGPRGARITRRLPVDPAIRDVATGFRIARNTD